MTITLLAAGVLTTSAQQPFMRTYYTATSYSIDLIELPGQRILTPMGALLLLDEEGSVLRRSAYHGGGTYLVQTLKPATSNEFYFTSGTIAAMCPATGGNSLIRPVLGRMDSLGRVQTMKYYELNSGLCSGTPEGLEVLDDRGAITWGRGLNFFAFKADSIEPIPSEWDFEIFPNPGHTEVFLHLSGDAPKDILLFDPSGRRIQAMSNITSTPCRLMVGHLAKGLYYVRVSAGLSTKVKKLIIQ